MAVKFINSYEWNKRFYAMVDRGDGVSMELKSIVELKPEEWLAKGEAIVAAEIAAVAEQEKAAAKELQDWQTKTQSLLAEKPIDAAKETVDVWVARVVSEKTTAEAAPIEEPIGEVIR